MKKLAYIISIIIFVVTSCSKPLTREDALTKLKNSTNYPVIKTYECIKSYIKDMDTQGRGVSIVIGEDENKEKEKILRQFENNGLLQLIETPQFSESNNFLLGTTIRTWTLVEVRLTDSGRKYLTNEDSKVYTLKLWETDVNEITGIREMEDKKTAVVDYTLTNKSITPFGEIFSDKNQTVNQTAYFVIYDDGWRIQQ
jgi:hypothetical protein